ncbi:MAG: hypothetical protein U1A78_19080 [Polyangia bacterium]
MDAKTIGYAAKDILIGIGTAVAGAKGGPEAAKGVSKAGDGIDRILENVMPGDKKQTREERFDRGDFASRAKTAPMQELTQQGTTAPQDTTPREVPRTEPADKAPPAAPPGERLGDAKTASDYLKSLGWAEEKVNQILGGPERTSLGALVGKEVGGTRVAHSEGEAIRPVAGRSHPKTSGFRQDPVDGVRVPDDAQST